MKSLIMQQIQLHSLLTIPILNFFFFIFIIHSIIAQVSSAALTFSDKTAHAGIEVNEGPSLKYGGASIADLDGDGFSDFILGHHVDNATIYFNNGDGTFTKNSFAFRADVHAITPYRISPRHKAMRFIASIGGAMATKRHSPRVFTVYASNDIRIITEEEELTAAAGRGRSAVPIQLDNNNNNNNNNNVENDYTDLIIVNAKDDLGVDFHFILSGINDEGGLINENPSGTEVLSNEDGNWWIFVTDINRDGIMEVITYHSFRIYSFNENMRSLFEITHYVLPRGLDVRACSAIAELDIDNDGWMDLYLGRSSETHGHNYMNDIYSDEPPQDLLLRNIGGRYVDITEYANIPKNTHTVGVTTGDFDNDGYIDLILIQSSGDVNDIYLRNLGDGRFETLNPGFNRLSSVAGDMATAVDYDHDGRLDVLLSEGHYADRLRGGKYRLMQNTFNERRSFLLIRIGNSPLGKTTALHAIVYVKPIVNGYMQMTRRVGSPGTAVSNSFIETVHFGLGDFDQVDEVRVLWTDGGIVTLTGVDTNQMITMGSFLR